MPYSKIMRSPLYLFIFPILFLMLSCSPKTGNSSAGVLPDTPFGIVFMESPQSGLVTLETTGFGKSSSKAEKDGIERAFKAILFDGLPAYSALRTPMVSDKNKQEQSNPNVFNDFFSTKTYEQFITTREIPKENKGHKNAEKHQVSTVLTINYASLRKYMEKMGGVRKFGL